MNSFVCFLEEFMAWQFAFEINWPLADKGVEKVYNYIRMSGQIFATGGVGGAWLTHTAQGAIHIFNFQLFLSTYSEKSVFIVF